MTSEVLKKSCGCFENQVCGHAVIYAGPFDRPSVNEDKIKSVNPHRLHLVVTHSNENVTYHAVGSGKPWKIDAGLQLLVIGKGVGRVMVPLCNIMYFTLEEY
jgi:hypothetical protein